MVAVLYFRLPDSSDPSGHKRLADVSDCCQDWLNESKVRLAGSAPADAGILVDVLSELCGNVISAATPQTVPVKMGWVAVSNALVLRSLSLFETEEALLLAAARLEVRAAEIDIGIVRWTGSLRTPSGEHGVNVDERMIEAQDHLAEVKNRANTLGNDSSIPDDELPPEDYGASVVAADLQAEWLLSGSQPVGRRSMSVGIAADLCARALSLANEALERFDEAGVSALGLTYITGSNTERGRTPQSS